MMRWFISGNLEFNERRVNATGQSERPMVMAAKLLADSTTDGDL